MDPERNHGGNPSPSGDDTTKVDAVSAPVEPRMVMRVPSPRLSNSNESGDEDVQLQPASSATPSNADDARSSKTRRTRLKAGSHPNNVRKLRQGAMMSKAELARRAGVSPLTIDRVEAGCPCRMDTKRKILEALGLQPSAARDVFPDLDQP